MLRFAVLAAAIVATSFAAQCLVDFEGIQQDGGTDVPNPVSCQCNGQAQSASFFSKLDGALELEPARIFNDPYNSDLDLSFIANPNNRAWPFVYNVDNGTQPSNAGSVHLGSGFMRKADYFIKFDQPVQDISLLVYDFKGDGGGFIGQAAMLTAFADDDFQQPIGTDRFWVVPGLPDGSVHRLTVCESGIRSASLVFEHPKDVAAAFDNVEWCCDGDCGQCSSPDNEIPPGGPPNSGCPLDYEKELLETIWEPVLDAEDSGFSSRDTISIHFDNPDAFRFVDATNHGSRDNEAIINHGDPEEDVTANSLHLGTPYTAPRECYTRYEVKSPWSELVDTCAREETQTEIIFTCKTQVENSELTIGVIRGVPISRTIISEFPWKVRFPKQVDVHLEDLSVFDNANNIAAIIYQSVDVDVNDLSVDATVRLFSSLQWPFKCENPKFFSETPGVTVAAGTHQDCPDTRAGDVADRAPSNDDACGQVWEIKLSPDGSVCELDGTYRMTCDAVCQPSFAQLTDCPLIQDDLGGVNNEISVTYTLDSEDFCPKVVDNVDIDATLTAYKDLAHATPATNFILGQTIYFKAETFSEKATIVQTGVDHLSIMVPGPNDPNRMITLFDQGANIACDLADNGDAGNVRNLIVQDSCESGVATEAWFQWLICEDADDCPFAPPVDGQQDFDVWVTLDITFKDVANNGALLEEDTLRKGKASMLLQAQDSYSGNRRSERVSASTVTGSFAAAASEDDGSSSSASSLVALVAMILPFAALA